MSRLAFTSASERVEASLTLPEKLDADGILVGWSMEAEHARIPIGFTFGDRDRTPATGFVDPIIMEGEGHLITIAPTGAGKGIGCIVPTLLRHRGPAIVVDPKGENAIITARRRREMGQAVVIIDPTGVTGLEQGSLNPLDLIDPRDASSVTIASSVVNAMLPSSVESDRNRYWLNRARQLLTGVCLHCVTDLAPQQRTLAQVRELINTAAGNPKDLADRLRESRHPEARLIEGNLRIAASETLGAILSFAQEGVDFLGGPQVQVATGSTSFDLTAVTRGEPLTIYIVLPPHLMEPLGRILRLWISTLLTLIMVRQSRPALPTLFLLDEAAQLGELGELRTAITLLRGYGLQTWSFWQDVSQLKQIYPRDWQTMINNCRVIQSFGANNLNAAADMANLVGFASAEQILNLERSEMLLQIAGDEAVFARRPNYLTDPIFYGMFNSNPLFDPTRDPVPLPNHIRSYLRPEKTVLPFQPPERAVSKVRLGPGERNPIDEALSKELHRTRRRR